MKPPLLTSPRRWERDGFLPTVFSMWFYRAAYFFGVKPSRLVRWYYGAGALNASFLLFTRAPEPGAVKTRLIPTLGASGACQLHQQLVANALGALAAMEDSHRVLAVAGDPSAPAVQAWQAQAAASVWKQEGEDLGERMYRGLLRANESGGAAVLFGSDCPPIDGVYLREAVASLEHADVVLGLPRMRLWADRYKTRAAVLVPGHPLGNRSRAGGDYSSHRGQRQPLPVAGAGMDVDDAEDLLRWQKWSVTQTR